MEIRVLEYFLAVAREQNISRAAGYLHLTQPTLSRQLKELEEELGQQLFVRGNRKITLTQDGMFLRKRAQEIVDLVKKTENEMHAADKEVAGEISIGAAETDAVRTVVQLVRQLQTEHHDIRLHIFSGDAVDTLEKLEKGLIDFAVLVGERDLSKYECLHLPKPDSWGVLMRRDSALAGKTRITPEDLAGQPLILSRQSTSNRELMAWLQSGGAKPNVTARMIYTNRKLPPPYCAARYGKRHRLPRPTAEPAAASTKPMRLEKLLLDFCSIFCKLLPYMFSFYLLLPGRREYYSERLNSPRNCHARSRLSRW